MSGARLLMGGQTCSSTIKVKRRQCPSTLLRQRRGVRPSLSLTGEFNGAALSDGQKKQQSDGSDAKRASTYRFWGFF